MGYRIGWKARINWVPPGMGGATQIDAQCFTFVNSGVVASPGFGAGGALNATDIANMVAAISADLTAQLSANPALAQIQGWPTGTP